MKHKILLTKNLRIESKGKTDGFREWAYSIKSEVEEITRKSRHIPNLPADRIITTVAEKIDATPGLYFKSDQRSG